MTADLQQSGGRLSRQALADSVGDSGLFGGPNQICVLRRGLSMVLCLEKFPRDIQHAFHTYDEKTQRLTLLQYPDVLRCQHTVQISSLHLRCRCRSSALSTNLTFSLAWTECWKSSLGSESWKDKPCRVHASGCSRNERQIQDMFMQQGQFVVWWFEESLKLSFIRHWSGTGTNHEVYHMKDFKWGFRVDVQEMFRRYWQLWRRCRTP